MIWPYALVVGVLGFAAAPQAFEQAGAGLDVAQDTLATVKARVARLELRSGEIVGLVDAEMSSWRACGQQDRLWTATGCRDFNIMPAAGFYAPGGVTGTTDL